MLMLNLIQTMSTWKFRYQLTHKQTLLKKAINLQQQDQDQKR